MDAGAPIEWCRGWFEIKPSSGRKDTFRNQNNAKVHCLMAMRAKAI
jgi:hypothetical protein